MSVRRIASSLAGFLAAASCALEAAPNDAAERAAANAAVAARAGVPACEADDATLRYIGKVDTLPGCLGENPDPWVLRITSGGGEVNAGIAAGRIVAERGMSVEVFGICASSCANYVVPAAAELSVLPYSVIVLHGAPANDPDVLRADIERAVATADLPEGVSLPDGFVDAQLRDALATRAAHDRFANAFGVGDAWYDLAFARADGGDPDVVPDRAMVEACLPTVPVGAFWTPSDPRTDVVDAAVDFTYVGHDVGVLRAC